MTAALVMTACSNDNSAIESPALQSAVKTIPYTVTVGQGEAIGTRATVESDLKTLKFAAGDKLYVSSDSRADLTGVLTLKSGDEGKTSGATFEGSLAYTGDAPAAELAIKATLVGASNVGVQITGDKVTGITYPNAAYCSDVNDAVEKYSNLTGTATYGAQSFSLSQQTAFLNFVITFEDGTATGTALSAKVNNNSTDICTASVTTTTESEKVVAKFVLPVAKGTTLSSATVKMGDKAAISFGASQTLEGKVYNVKKTQEDLAPALNLTSPAVGQIIGSDGKNYAANATLPDGVTKVAVIAYVNGNNGLALALQDAGTMSWADANTAAENATPKFSNATWRVPTNDDWWKIFGQSDDVNTNNPLTSTQLAGYILGAGGSNFQEDQNYWSGSEHGVGSAWTLRVTGALEGDVDADFYDVPKSFDDVCVRLCLAF